MEAPSSSPGASTWQFDQIPASVAPPPATTVIRGLCSHSRTPRSTGTQSPETRTKRRPASSPGPQVSRSIDACAGAEFHRFTPCLVTSSTHTPGSAYVAGGGMTRDPPRPITPNRSKTDRSKPSEETIRPRSPAPVPHLAATSSMVVMAPRWVITTPFGSPVDPEVKMT